MELLQGAGRVVNKRFASSRWTAYLGDWRRSSASQEAWTARLLKAPHAAGIAHYLGVRPGSGIRPESPGAKRGRGIFRGTPPTVLSFDNAWPASGLGEKDLVINAISAPPLLASQPGRSEPYLGPGRTKPCGHAGSLRFTEHPRS